MGGAGREGRLLTGSLSHLQHLTVPSPPPWLGPCRALQVVLAEKQQSPFTNQPLQFEQLKVLTKTNIHLHKDKIVNGTTTQAAAP